MRQGYYARNAADWTPTDGPLVRRLIRAGTQMVRLEEDLLYIGRRGDRSLATRGMESDGGSKPSLLWSLIGHPYDGYLPAYLIHDSECKMIRHLLASNSVTQAWARRLRRKADRRMLEGIRYLARHKLAQGGWWTRFVARAHYRAVRCQAARELGL